MPVRITAIMCVRNEEGYLRTTLSHLVRNGVRLMIIDNESTDGTRRIIDEFADSVDWYEWLPWIGALDMVAIMEVKTRLSGLLREGWIIHQDADEILESSRPTETLSESIARIDQTGANAINFDEFVFLPLDGMSIRGADFRSLVRHYYFHEPGKLRLMRVWRADAQLSQLAAGHLLTGHVRRVHSENLALRHYPFLDIDHARRKYATRRFADRGIAMGWHANRRFIEPTDMDFPAAERLRRWNPGEPLDTSDPWPAHYWVTARDSRMRRLRA